MKTLQVEMKAVCVDGGVETDLGRVVVSFQVCGDETPMIMSGVVFRIAGREELYATKFLVTPHNPRLTLRPVEVHTLELVS